MATLPQWDKSVSRHSLSNFDRYAKAFADGVSNDKFRADVAKMGGIDKYRQALVNFEKDYIKYQIDFAKENGYLNDLSDRYQKAIDSGLFSAAETKAFKTAYDKLQPTIAEAARQKELDQIAKEQRRARLEAAANISGPLLTQAGQESNALIAKAQGEREAAKKQIEEQYQNDYKTINDLYSAGQITEAQRDAARDQAEANWSSAMETVKSNYTAASNAINALYDKNEAYIRSLDADIRSGKASPTGKYTINSTPAGLKPVTASYSLASSAIPRVEDLPEQQPEVDPYAGMTIQERMEAKKSDALARIAEEMAQPKPTVEAKSLDDMIAELTPQVQAQRAEAARGYTKGPGGLTLDQSEEIAKVLTAFTGVGQVTDDEGKPYDDPIGAITNRVFNEGYQPVLDSMLEQGGVRPVPGNYIDRAVAEDFAKTMLKRNNFNLTHLDDWANNVQANGFESAAQAFKEVNGKENYFLPSITDAVAEDGSSLTPKGNIQDFIDRNNTAIQTLQDTATTKVDDAITRVMAGLPALPTVPEGMTAQEVLDQIYTSSNFNLTPDFQDYMTDYADKFGIDTALAYLDLVANPTDQAGRGVDIYNPIDDLYTAAGPEPIIADRGEPTLGTTGPTLPSTTELGVPVQRGEVTPAAGIGALTPAPTTSGIPMGGGIPGGGITTYQPAPYTPPPLISQAPARPTLTPLEQLIGTPDVTRPVGAPMQALTPQQAGSQFVPPTQEDYYAFFGYTPEQLNAEQYLAELEGAPRAGIGAQTVPVLPAAVTGAPAPTGMKEGGMPQDAQRLASKGRGGDSMLVHMAPEEIAGLQALALQNGTSLTINPETGLPEALSLRDILGPIVVIGGSILSGGAATPGLLSLAYGVGSAIGSGSIEKGIAAGLSAYGGANLISGGYTAITDKVIPGFQLPPTGAEGVAVGKGGVETGVNLADKVYGDVAGTYGVNVPDPTLLDSAIAKLSGPATVPTDLNSAYLKGALPLTTGMSLQEGIEQREAYDDYMAKVGVENEAERKRNRQLFESTLGSVPTQYVRAGGLMSLAGGGVSYAEGGGTTGPTNEPRMVKGTGDGMSDSVPATIEGVQEARLANDEFVIPADVVADLGNGSSSAGAKQLYAMMDRVRKARHGTTEQPPEIDVMKLMPA